MSGIADDEKHLIEKTVKMDLLQRYIYFYWSKYILSCVNMM